MTEETQHVIAGWGTPSDGSHFS